MDQTVQLLITASSLPPSSYSCTPSIHLLVFFPPSVFPLFSVILHLSLNCIFLFPSLPFTALQRFFINSFFAVVLFLRFFHNFLHFFFSIHMVFHSFLSTFSHLSHSFHYTFLFFLPPYYVLSFPLSTLLFILSPSPISIFLFIFSSSRRLLFPILLHQ